jgi:flagellar hook-associated protein 2
MRMTGLASGLDIDGMVKRMLSPQQTRIDRAKQQRELVNWQKDAYRSVITKLNGFQSRFLDILSPSSMMRQTSFRQMSTSVPSDMSQFFTATASSDSHNASVTVNSIRQLATAQRIESMPEHRLSQPISMTVSASENLSGGVAGILGQSISFTVNGDTRSITLSNTAEDYFDDVDRNSEGRVTSVRDLDITKLTEDINRKLRNEFGTVNGQARISINENSIEETLDRNNHLSGYRFSFDVAASTTVQVSGSVSVTSALGFANNVTNFANLNSTLASVFGNRLTSAIDGEADTRIRFSINEVEFNFARTSTLRDVINEVNRSAAGVTMSYSSFDDRFTITSNRTGSGDFIRLSESVEVPETDELGRIVLDSDGLPSTDTAETNFLRLLFGSSAGSGANGNGSVPTIGRVTQGQDAVLTVNGNEIIRASNSITVDGITINLLQTTPEDFNNTEAVTSRVDSSQVMDLIKNFIEEYNSLVETLNNLLSDRRPRSNNQHYMPLTEEQRGAMNEKDIEMWEEMGKKGLLNNDPTISRMLSNLRMSVMGAVESPGGGRMSFASIGIGPGSFFEDRSGKLNIDEDRLRQAIESDPDSVMRLFTQQSDIPSGARMEDHFQRDSHGRFYRLAAEGDRSVHTININGEATRVVFVTERDFREMRNSSMGISHRFADIFNANLNVTLNERDRGTLIQKAGTGGANVVIDRESTFDKRIADMERNITRIQNRFFDLETKYFRQFAQMETAMTRLNKQSSFLMGFGE